MGAVINRHSLCFLVSVLHAKIEIAMDIYIWNELTYMEKISSHSYIIVFYSSMYYYDNAWTFSWWLCWMCAYFKQEILMLKYSDGNNNVD